MPRVLVTGGTGTLGRALVPRLVAEGYTVRVMSRSSSPPADWPEPATEWAQADLATGAGLAAAVSDVDSVIHTATHPRRSATVDVEGTKRLIDHLCADDLQQFLYVSLVGIDEIPYSYYQHKLAAEAAVVESGLPWTIQRVTQFHTLLDRVFQTLCPVPIWPLPTAFQVQPIAPADVATRLCDIIGDGPARLVPNLGGPEVHRLGEVARIWADVRDVRRPIVCLPVSGRIAKGFREGHNTVPHHRAGTTTYRD